MIAFVEIVLSWPDSALMPNRNIGRHWAMRHNAKSAAKNEAIDQSQKWRGVFPAGAALAVFIKLEPPDRRKRDIDNLLAALKPSIDGMAQGLGINDAQICRTVIDLLEPTPGGRVLVSVHVHEAYPEH